MQLKYTKINNTHYAPQIMNVYYSEKNILRFTNFLF